MRSERRDISQPQPIWGEAGEWAGESAEDWVKGPGTEEDKEKAVAEEGGDENAMDR